MIDARKGHSSSSISVRRRSPVVPRYMLRTATAEAGVGSCVRWYTRTAGTYGTQEAGTYARPVRAVRRLRDVRVNTGARRRTGRRAAVRPPWGGGGGRKEKAGKNLRARREEGTFPQQHLGAPPLTRTQVGEPPLVVGSEAADLVRGRVRVGLGLGLGLGFGLGFELGLGRVRGHRRSTGGVGGPSAD